MSYLGRTEGELALKLELSFSNKKYCNRVFGRNLFNFIAIFFAMLLCSEPQIKHYAKPQNVICKGLIEIVAK